MEIKNKIKCEKGELLILFSVVLVILLMFTGAATDFMLYSNKKDKIQEIAYLIKDTRYDLAEPLFNSNNPEGDLQEIANTIALQNGINPSNVKVKWNEQINNNGPVIQSDPDEDGGFIVGKRVATTIIEVSEVYDPVFLKMFNINEMPIKVTISDDLEKDTEHGYVWVPYK